MISFFTTAKPFKNHAKIIQENAIRSWTLLQPKPEIMLFGNEPGAREIAKELDLRYFPEVARNEFGTPMFNDLFEKAGKTAKHPFLCYVNADIILMNDFMKAAGKLLPLKRLFLMIGQRWEVDVPELLAFPRGWDDKLKSRVKREGLLCSILAADYFLFPRGLYQEIPPLTIGRTTFDCWLIYQARKLRASVVNATEEITAVHQKHDYSHVAGDGDEWERTWRGAEAKRNRKLVSYFCSNFSIEESTDRLAQGKLRGSLLGRIYVYYAVRLFKDYWFLYIWYPLLRISRPLRRLFTRGQVPTGTCPHKKST